MKIFDVRWETRSAGPSPTGYRTELYLKGCSRAMDGRPCPGCFNTELWSDETEFEHTPQGVAQKLIRFGSKHITIVGGEPTDQLVELIELCRLLQAADRNILVFTGLDLITEIDPGSERYALFLQLLSVVNAVVDGAYSMSERIYQLDSSRCLPRFIGSGNQRFWYKEGDIWIGNPVWQLKDIHQLHTNQWYLERWFHEINRDPLTVCIRPEGAR